MSHLPDEKYIAAYHDMYVRDKKTVRDIAVHLGVSGYTVCRRFQKLGLKTRKRGKVCVTDEKYTTAYRERYLKGACMRAVAKELGVSHQAVSIAFDRLGLEKRARGEHVRTMQRCSNCGMYHHRGEECWSCGEGK